MTQNGAALANPLVIFDLDGTLVDTAPDLIDSLNHTIVEVGMEPLDFSDVTYLVGQGVRVMIARAFELRHRNLDDATADRLFHRFLDHYRKAMPGRSKPYPGTIECLDRLASAGMDLAVCTNKIEELALPLLGELGLTRRFAAITGGDTFAARKPDARHIFGTIERAGGIAQQAVMIGDSVNDILAARNAGIPSIAVTFGYSDVPVTELGASIIVESYDEIDAPVILSLLSASPAKAAAGA